MAAVAALALAGTALFAQSGLFSRLVWWSYDTHQRALAEPVNLDDVLVVDIDEASFARLAPAIGQAQSERVLLARVGAFLQQSGARAVAYHLPFGEPRPGDDAFAAIVGSDIVVAAVGLPVPQPDNLATSARLDAVSLRALGARPEWPKQNWLAIKLPPDSIATLRPGNVGVVNLQPDTDGTLRRPALLHATGPHLLPSLPLGVLMARKDGRPRLDLDGNRLRVGTLQVGLTDAGEVLVRFPSNASSLRIIPFRDLYEAMEGRARAGRIVEAVHGRTVLVGRTVPPMGDYVQTPVGTVSGLQLAALTTALIENGRVLAPGVWWIDILLLLVALVPPLYLVSRAQRSNGSHFVAALTAQVLVLAGAGTLLFATGIHSSWVFALVSGASATALAAAVWVVSVMDDRRKLALETATAREANRLKTEFLNHLTHELRTPLTAIMGFNKINQLTDDLGKSARIRNSEVIGRNCEHLLVLINNHLDLAKLAAGTLQLAPAPEDPERLLREVLASLRSLADDKRIRLRFVKRTPLPAALALDASRVRQVLINLLGNALKFTQTGSVELAVAWHVAVLDIEVRDTGPGIAGDALERIFEPFEQADSSVASRFGGTGLGLTIAKQLVDLMGGSIDVESQPGVGTAFRVRIPCEPAGRRELKEPASLAAARGMLAGRILLAEDNEDIRNLVELQLSRLGLEVRAVANGFSAVDAALAERFDVILMDMEMPVMNGYEAVHVLRTRGCTATILALTAHHAGAEAERAIAAGCDGLVTKPATLESLQAALQPLLPGLPRRAASSERHG
ncbi:MAG: CHASE2 domain-containing protein [Burkholderiales bacterium]|jgi:signal transduction histidine kinase/ActR/RegA family two-component response regulator|nr:CHASE2 domain-containing protein [Burkholderiales bacterium]